MPTGVYKRIKVAWNKGKPLTEDHKNKISKSHKSNPKMSFYGKLGAEKRWAGHTKQIKKYKYKYLSYGKRYPEGSTEKKRFTNQRYKARKKGASGLHTFEQWLELKILYNFMCLCCKKFEPQVKLTEDHIIPLSFSGSDFIENIQPLCQSCNTRKLTKIIDYRLLSINSNLGEKVLVI